MTVEGTAGEREMLVPGRTVVTARALQHLAVGIVRDIAGVDVGDVGVRLADERGALRLSVTVPVALPGAAEATLVDRGAQLQNELIDGMRRLAARDVSTVDVRYSRVRRDTGRRVR